MATDHYHPYPVGYRQSCIPTNSTNPQGWSTHKQGESRLVLKDFLFSQIVDLNDAMRSQQGIQNALSFSCERVHSAQ